MTAKQRAANGSSSIYFGADGRWHGRVSMGSDPGTGHAIRRQVTAKTQAEVTRKVRVLEKAREQGMTTGSGASRQTVQMRKRSKGLRPQVGYPSEDSNQLRVSGHLNQLRQVRSVGVTYNFRNLSPYDFETVICDLSLNA
jgi:hypothetical protein